MLEHDSGKILVVGVVRLKTIVVLGESQNFVLEDKQVNILRICIVEFVFLVFLGIYEFELKMMKIHEFGFEWKKKKNMKEYVEDEEARWKRRRWKTLKKHLEIYLSFNFISFFSFNFFIFIFIFEMFKLVF